MVGGVQVWGKHHDCIVLKTLQSRLKEFQYGAETPFEMEGMTRAQNWVMERVFVREGELRRINTTNWYLLNSLFRTMKYCDLAQK